MPYSRALKKVIANTEFTQEEIANKCKEQGIKVSRTYINKLLNNKQKAPTEEISRAIAKVCNADERILVVEGYIDKAPKEIDEAFRSLKQINDLVIIGWLENDIDKKAIHEKMEQLNNETLSEFIISLIDNGKYSLNTTKGYMEIKAEEDNLYLSLAKPVGIKVEDNSMYPLIKQNDEVMLQIKETYKNGEIVVIKIKKENKIVIRQILNLGNQIELIPLNKQYEPKSYDKKDIICIGMVKKIITEI